MLLSPDMSKKTVRYIVTICIATIVFGAAVLWLIQEPSKQNKTIPLDPRAFYKVTRVLDGDTFNVEVDKKEITIRMLGINTPETVDPRRPPECYGKEASDATKNLLKGQQVNLVLNKDREVRDKYGRYLAYVYREDGLFVNEYLLEEGFAKEYTYGSPYSLQKNFLRLEQNANKNKVGLWQVCNIDNLITTL
jgi:micrococcal nuclease